MKYDPRTLIAVPVVPSVVTAGEASEGAWQYVAFPSIGEQASLNLNSLRAAISILFSHSLDGGETADLDIEFFESDSASVNDSNVTALQALKQISIADTDDPVQLFGGATLPNFKNTCGFRWKASLSRADTDTVTGIVSMAVAGVDQDPGSADTLAAINAVDMRSRDNIYLPAFWQPA